MSDVCTAIIPQPMSTPTAAGMIAPTVGMTLPTVAPIPQCTSGITATHWWMNGIRATLRELRGAAASNGTPRVHALIGTPPSGWTADERSVDWRLARLVDGCAPAGTTAPHRRAPDRDVLRKSNAVPLRAGAAPPVPESCQP